VTVVTLETPLVDLSVLSNVQDE